MAAEPALADYLRDLTSIVAGTLSAEGFFVERNLGLQELLSRLALTAPVHFADACRLPRWQTLRESVDSFAGLFQFSSAERIGETLRGRLMRDGNGFFFIAEPLRDDHARLQETLLTLNRESTARQRLLIDERDEARRRVEQLTRRCEHYERQLAFLEAISSAIGEGTIAFDVKGRISFFNPTAEQLFGVSVGSILGKPIRALSANFVVEPPFFGKEPFHGTVLLDIRRLDGTRIPVGCTGRQTPAGDTVLLFSDRRLLNRLAEVEDAVRRESERAEQWHHEASALLRLVENPTRATGELFGRGALRDSAPQLYQELASEYATILDLTLDQVGFRVDHRLAERLRSLSTRLGFLQAGARDVVSLHAAVIQERTRSASSQKAQAYLQEGRFLLLELMGRLVNYYRAQGRPTRVDPPATASPPEPADG